MYRYIFQSFTTITIKGSVSFERHLAPGDRKKGNPGNEFGKGGIQAQRERKEGAPPAHARNNIVTRLARVFLFNSESIENLKNHPPLKYVMYWEIPHFC